MKTLVVYHTQYGCHSGCCGHVIDLDGMTEFSFSHPLKNETDRDFAERILRKEFHEYHLVDLDWEHARIEVSGD